MRKPWPCVPLTGTCTLGWYAATAREREYYWTRDQALVPLGPPPGAPRLPDLRGPFCAAKKLEAASACPGGPGARVG